MRLSSVQLNRFKAVERADIAVAPVTVLIGPNSAGKSSLLQALALLQQSSLRAEGFSTTGPAVDLGLSVAELVHRPPSGTPEPWQITTTFEQPPVGAERRDPGVRVVVSCSYGPEHARPRVAFEIQIPVGGDGVLAASGSPNVIPYVDVRFNQRPDLPKGPDLAWRHQYKQATSWAFTTDSTADANVPSIPLLPDAVGAAAVHVPEYVSQIGVLLQAFRYVGPDRTVDRSVYTLGDGPVADPRRANEVMDVFVYDRAALEAVSRDLHRVFGYHLDVELLPQKLVSLVAYRDGARPRAGSNIVNQGSGFVQMIWILLQMYLARQSVVESEPEVTVTVGIEEPELHLHPRVQDTVARIFADQVGRGIQVLLTTQSEHFLTAILQRVLEGSLAPDQLAVYYVEDGNVTALEVDEAGRLSGGLRGFFEADEAQLQRQIELLLKRA